MMNNKLTISAPGKLMLFGEHAVVYDYPCLVTAVGQRMRASVEFTDEQIFSLDAVDVNITGYIKSMAELGRGEIPKGAQFVEVAIKNFIEKYPITTGIKVTTISEFSSKFGFGSSSASTVCVVKALALLSDKKLSHKEIFNIAYKTVLDIQGKGSGFDVAAAIYGGTLYFVTGGKIIEPLPIQNIPLIVGYTGIKADTVMLMGQVSQKKKENPEKVGRIFQAIAKLVDEAKQKILEGPARNASASVAGGDWERAGTLMDFNQKYLRDLGVSSEKLETLISAAKSAGAYGAKLSGAGGGDCMIALGPSTVKEAIRKAGGEVIDVTSNAEGVRIEP